MPSGSLPHTAHALRVRLRGACVLDVGVGGLCQFGPAELGGGGGVGGLQASLSGSIMGERSASCSISADDDRSTRRASTIQDPPALQVQVQVQVDIPGMNIYRYTIEPTRAQPV